MPLRIIKTGLTSRKCDRYVKEIKEYISPDGKRKLILMVPDRFSYNAEKLICDELGGTGFNGVSVQTLHQFIRKNASSADKVLLNEGKQMLLRRIINKCIDESSVFYGAKERNGFIESVLEVLEDWKRFCIDLNELESEINSLPDGITRHKLTVLKTVFEAYRKEFDKNKYKDEADLLFDTSAEIRNSAGYSDAIVWIDGFVEFVPAETEIISAFLSVGADVRIYLPCKPGGNVDTDDVYSVPQRTCYNLCKLCKEHGFQYSVVEEAYECNTNSELSFLCETYDDRDAVFSGEVNSIVLREADDVYEEVENAAREIVKLVSSKNCDFSDISILCGDINGYSSCIEAVFSRYSIPYFSDYKVPLLNHPVSILLTSVFEIVRNKSFPASHMIRYLKTGYIVSDNNDIDYLSLYIAKRGIRGGMWKEDKYFEMLPGGFFDEALGKSGKVNLRSKRLIGMRKIVSEPLYAYYEKTKGKKTVSEHVTAFFDFMNDIKLFDKIHENIQNFESVGENNEAARLAHVWNLLVNLFDQMVAMSGDEKISRATFGEYFKAGIEGSEISIIPAVQNGVSVSDAGHRKGSGVKALIILGATRDTVPAVKREDGLITENELESVKSLPGTVGKAYRNLSKEFELVTAFSETSDFLYISWCSMGAGGEKTIKSPVFEFLMAKFPGLGFTNCDTSEFIASPESMLHKLLTRISNNEKLSAYDIAVKEWFLSGDEWKDAFLLLEEAEKYSELVGCISKDVAKELYKNLTQYSVSRLEKYFQCPFMYYLSYGLHLDDGEVYGLKSTDTGNVVHHALAKFCQLVETGAETKEEKRSCWQNITDKE
ncbi:MAG: PD-(D/E)XK nuclease family protein, partial [Clostridia bacterium]|nr:PD-(D/E)XK nuclease family protein [Clostridia bacterium]